MSIDLLTTADFQPRGLEDVAARLMGKALVTPEEFAALSEAQRRRAFSALNLHNEGVLRQIRERIATAVKSGTPFRTVRRDLLRILKSAGADSPSMHRLQFLYQHHVTRAMAEGRDDFLKQDHVAAAFPYWEYATVGSPGHRATHEKLKGVYSVTDPGWAYFNPPWEPG